MAPYRANSTSSNFFKNFLFNFLFKIWNRIDTGEQNMSENSLFHWTAHRGSMAELMTAYRFIEAGRRVSLPLGPYPYDLIVDSGDRLSRIQVKQGHEQDGRPGYWKVRLTRRCREVDQALNTADFDYLVVACTPDVSYVIPAPCCASASNPAEILARLEIGPKSQWQPWLNKFGIGSGSVKAMLPARQLKKTHTSWGEAFHRRNGNVRKMHKRLSLEDSLVILGLPIKGYCFDGRPTVTMQQVAEQFGVSIPTIRNTLLRRRSDLKVRKEN